MNGSGEGAVEAEVEELVRASREFREGRIDRKALRRIVEGWAARVERQAGRSGEDPDGTIALPRAGPAPDHIPAGPREGSSPSGTVEGEETRGGGARFEVVGELAGGGLGVVYRAIDAELGREVALKQIRPERADDPESRARFEREGMITGALEHPGIVPVYGRGRFEDGRPFFAMRLVRGRSLREAISEFHREGSRPGSGGEATLRALVSRLAQACLAVEYAHSRGVVHRDLKPENILLGPFGETLVVDWGLARATGEEEAGPPRVPSPVSPLREGRAPGGEPIVLAEQGGEGTGTVAWGAPGIGPSRTEGESPWETRAGHVRGTIGYMSPEQARGEHDRVGPRSDVFGLGASLYCLLAGRPPVVGGDGMVASLARAIRGEYEPPGAVREGVDPELERICLRAIDPDPDRRFPSARALAEALDEWLAEERARTARALFSSALEAYGTLVTTVEDRLGTLPAAREAREELLSTAVSGLEGLIEHAERGQSAEVERALAEAHRQLGEIALRLGRSAEAGRHLERSLSAFEALVGSGRPEPGDRRGLSVVLGRLGDVCRRRGDAAGARHYYRRGLAAARALAAVEPRSGRAQRGLAIAYGKLGDLARQSGDAHRARSYLKRSLAIADVLARIAPESAEAMRGVAMALDKLGDVERQLGDLESARGYYRRAVSVAEAMAGARPDDPGARRSLIISGNKLGALLRLAGDLDGARAVFGRSMALAEAQARDDPRDVDARRDLAICCDRLGDVCRRSGDLPEAERYYARGLELARSLLEADPDSALARRGMSIALNKLAELHRLSDDPEEADRLHREALCLAESLADASPDDAQAQLDVAYICRRLGGLRASAGDSDGARSWFDRALARLRPLAARDCLPPAFERWIEALEGPVPGTGQAGRITPGGSPETDRETPAEP
ncbi:serine/threonine-protein kinase [Tautonia sociabilis]|uniref:Tetratricopeptide repeat protein n=1 Tax=Tautonia sociabilis TaxID=2080755 RepID=A0A432MFF2_9BACT|nr:serine/threonine-protein kinase [Tautonia sociabilis]RUL84666.1 tetratricopeptide repeat protein [Tautonia sociabilis]